MPLLEPSTDEPVPSRHELRLPATTGWPKCSGCQTDLPNEPAVGVVHIWSSRLRSFKTSGDLMDYISADYGMAAFSRLAFGHTKLVYVLDESSWFCQSCYNSYFDIFKKEFGLL